MARPSCRRCRPPESPRERAQHCAHRALHPRFLRGARIKRRHRRKRRAPQAWRPSIQTSSSFARWSPNRARTRSSCGAWRHERMPPLRRPSAARPSTDRWPESLPNLGLKHRHPRRRNPPLPRRRRRNLTRPPRRRAIYRARAAAAAAATYRSRTRGRDRPRQEGRHRVDGRRLARLRGPRTPRGDSAARRGL